MTSTIKEQAIAYEPGSYKNISDLSEISTDVQIHEEEKTNSTTGEPYKVKYIEVNGEKYRVPPSVLGSLKAIIEKKPDLTKFNVLRTGRTKEDTRYTIVPL